MSSNGGRGGARRRFIRLVFFAAGVFLTGIFYCGHKAPTGPAASDCPHPPDPLDTTYRIISPNGGETFHVGEQCTVRVISRLSGSALISIVIGPNILSPPSGPIGKYMQGNSAVDTVIFTVPDSLMELVGGYVSSVTDSCLIKVSSYAHPQLLDYSDCYFRIKNP
jgi:hypothetical protein